MLKRLLLWSSNIFLFHQSQTINFGFLMIEKLITCLLWLKGTLEESALCFYNNNADNYPSSVIFK